MAEKFTFDRIQMQRLVRQLVRDELGPRESYFTHPIPQEPVVDHLVGTAYSTITARSSGTPGTGQVQAKKFRSGTAADYADATGNLIDVLNFGAEIASGSYVVCHRHRESGKWLVDEDQPPFWCGANASTEITSDSDTLVPIGQDSVASAGSIWSLASSELTINTTRNFHIALTTHFYSAGGANVGCFAILQKWTGSAWDSSVYEAAKDWSHLRTVSVHSDGSGTPTIQTMCCAVGSVSVTSGEKYRVAARKLSAGDATFEVGVLLDIQAR